MAVKRPSHSSGTSSNPKVTASGRVNIGASGSGNARVNPGTWDNHSVADEILGGVGNAAKAAYNWEKNILGLGSKGSPSAPYKSWALLNPGKTKQDYYKSAAYAKEKARRFQNKYGRLPGEAKKPSAKRTGPTTFRDGTGAIRPIGGGTGGGSGLGGGGGFGGGANGGRRGGGASGASAGSDISAAVQAYIAGQLAPIDAGIRLEHDQARGDLRQASRATLAMQNAMRQLQKEAAATILDNYKLSDQASETQRIESARKQRQLTQDFSGVRFGGSGNKQLQNASQYWDAIGRAGIAADKYGFGLQANAQEQFMKGLAGAGNLMGQEYAQQRMIARDRAVRELGLQRIAAQQQAPLIRQQMEAQAAEQALKQAVAQQEFGLDMARLGLDQAALAEDARQADLAAQVDLVGLQQKAKPKGVSVTDYKNIINQVFTGQVGDGIPGNELTKGKAPESFGEAYRALTLAGVPQRAAYQAAVSRYPSILRAWPTTQYRFDFGRGTFVRK